MGAPPLEVLRELVRLIDYRTGCLLPALTTLMRGVKRSKDAVVWALADLRTHGFPEWLRRWERRAPLMADPRSNRRQTPIG